MSKICKQSIYKLNKLIRSIMKMFKHKTIKNLLIITVIFFTFAFFGVFTHLFEEDFDGNFHYPYDGDIEKLVNDLRHNKTPTIKPINRYNFYFLKKSRSKCEGIEELRLVYLIKSAPEHFERRTAIRASWGFEKRFSDVDIRTVFLLGRRDDKTLQKLIDQEYDEHHDIVQGYFDDNYYNNTRKTMMGFTWVYKYCPQARFYMFVDDDYYVSTKNVLRFIRNPAKYPEYVQLKYNSGRNLKQFDFDLDENARLYGGYVFNSAPHRHLSSPWYVSLKEYPYHMWPPYVTAGAYVLSREALFDMFFASYYTKHFRFDDIYVAILAYKSRIEPFHCDQFYFYKANYNPKLYEFLVASHGYADYEELLRVWTKEKSLGHA